MKYLVTIEAYPEELESLKEYYNVRVVEEKQIMPELNTIIKSVCICFNATLEQMKSRTRLRDIVEARQSLLYLAKKHTSNSLAKIGSICNRDHATVLHSIKQVKELNSKFGCPEFKRKFNNTQKRIKKYTNLESI